MQKGLNPSLIVVGKNLVQLFKSFLFCYVPASLLRLVPRPAPHQQQRTVPHCVSELVQSGGFQRVLTMVYNTRNCSVCGLCTSSGILQKRY
jgi:hypothetical protein